MDFSVTLYGDSMLDELRKLQLFPVCENCSITKPGLRSRELMCLMQRQKRKKSTGKVAIFMIGMNDILIKWSRPNWKRSRFLRSLRPITNKAFHLLKAYEYVICLAPPPIPEMGDLDLFSAYGSILSKTAGKFQNIEVIDLNQIFTGVNGKIDLCRKRCIGEKEVHWYKDVILEVAEICYKKIQQKNSFL